MNHDEFIIQHLGHRHRDSFNALVSPGHPTGPAAATFNNTLSQRDDDLGVCLVAETRDGRLIGVARAHGADRPTAILDLFIADSEMVGDALLRELAGTGRLLNAPTRAPEGGSRDHATT